MLGRVGGANGDVADEATALGGRATEWQYHCYGSWEDGDNARNIAWVKATEEALRPWTMTGIALNFVSDIDDTRVRSTFGAEKYDRLAGAQAALGPGQHLLDEPEHPARRPVAWLRLRTWSLW